MQCNSVGKCSDYEDTVAITFIVVKGYKCLRLI